MAKRDTATAKDKNRRIRQEALREQLANQGHIQHVVDLIKKITDDDDIDSLKLSRYKAAADLKMKLIAKYLPDLKAIEMTGPDGEPIDLRLAAREMTPEEAAAHYAELMRGKQ